MTTQRPFRFGTGAFHAPSATEYAALARKIEDDRASILSMARPVNFAAQTNHTFFELKQIGVQVVDRLCFDRAALVAESFAVFQFRKRHIALQGIVDEDSKPGLELLVSNRDRRVVNECLRFNVHKMIRDA